MANLIRLQPLVLFLPAIQRLLRDPRLADQFPHRHSQLRLLQHPYDLLHRKALPLHGKSPFLRWLILPETNLHCVSEIGEPLKPACNRSAQESLRSCELKACFVRKCVFNEYIDQHDVEFRRYLYCPLSTEQNTISADRGPWPM